MDFSTQIVPAVIILFANLLSGNHGSKRWETVTAVFGWAAIVSFIGYVFLLWSYRNHQFLVICFK